MLIALDTKKELVTAEEHLSKAKKYYCPSCKQPVHLKIGNVIRPHFAHFKNSACDVFSEGETEEHIQGKIQLYKWLKKLGIKIEMEAYLPELRQRPDLLVFLGSQKIALEFQCSPISVEKVIERSLGYLDAGYKVIWILGNKFKYASKLTAFQKVCLTNIKNKLVLCSYDVTKRELKYCYNFRMNQKQKMKCFRKKIKWGNRIELELGKHQTSRTNKINIKEEHFKLLKKLRYPRESLKPFVELLYRNKQTIISMPKEVYKNVPSQWLIQTYSFEWKFRFLLWIEKQPLQTIITEKKLKRWISDAEDRGRIEYFDMPQMSTEQKSQPFYEFIKVLEESHILKEIISSAWSIIQYPKYFKHLEDKFK